MKQIGIVLVFLLAFSLLVMPASALLTNNSQNAKWVSEGAGILSASFIHDTQYVPATYEWAFITVGLGCLAISRVFKSAEDVFCVLAIIPCGLAAYYANYMSYDVVKIMIDGTGATNLVYAQIVAPNPALSVAMALATTISVANFVWVFFIQDRKLEKKNTPEPKEQ
jgi:hypothetical protein